MPLVTYISQFEMSETKFLRFMKVACIEVICEVFQPEMSD